MIKVAFDPVALTGPLRQEWDAWEAKAENAIDEVIDAWEDWKADQARRPEDKFEVTWKSAIWSELKAWLKTNIFADKCAYCETLIGRFVGDAEHYRPKGRVSVKVDGKSVRVLVSDVFGTKIQHPGYFWLAYDWQNLLPSCERCNKLQGKGDQFPVSTTTVHVLAVKLDPAKAAQCHNPHPSKKWPGWYYLRSEDLNAIEKPLLLHPFFDEPHSHLRFGYAGVEAAVDGSERALASIRVYDLADGSLRTQRQRAQERAEYLWNVGYMGPKPVQQAIQDGLRAIDGVAKGTEPYSAAARDWLREKYPNCHL